MTEPQNVHASPSPAAETPDPSIPSTNLTKSFGQWFRDFFTVKNFLERRTTWVVLGVGSLALLGLKVAILPIVASHAVDVIAEGYGIDMKVEDWSAGLLDLSASAKDVVVTVPGSFAKSELLTIDKMELDLSLIRALRGKGWIHEVRIIRPKLYLERQLNGAWNWQELGSLDRVVNANFEQDAKPAAREDSKEDSKESGAMAASGKALFELFGGKQAFNLNRLRIDGMRLEWVENLPGNSGGGLINEQKATLFFDDMEIAAQDFVGLLDLRPKPTRLKISARTADGKISMSGQANFFHWAQGSGTSEEKGVQRTASKVAWSPTFDIQLYLENVGAGGFARLTPEVAIRPERGSMSGTVDLALHDYQFDCNANLDLREVTFTVNRKSPLLARRGAQIEREVERLRPVSGQYQFACGGLGTNVAFRPVHAFQARVTQEALHEAPLPVRAVAAADRSRYTPEPLEPEYRTTMASMTEGVDPKLVGWMKVVRQVRQGLDTSGGIRSRLPFTPSFGGFR